MGKFEDERKAMVELLRKRGIKDENVLRAMEKVPRHLFVPEAFIHYAYEDSALPIGFYQTISQPYTVALMTEALALYWAITSTIFSSNLKPLISFTITAPLSRACLATSDL